jgi:SAM-dependent methyltransferase
VARLTEALYAEGGYLQSNPTWHVEDSLWKARQIRSMLERHALEPQTIAEVGCGAGEILKQLEHLLPDATLVGYEVSPQALEFARGRESERLRFELKDFCDDDVPYDLVLLIDVVEHVEDHFSFLRQVRAKAGHVLLHLPLDLSVQSVLRSRPILEKRSSVGHIHYFTKELALATLIDAGYDVVDHFYTFSAIELPAQSWRQHVMRLPRRMAFAARPDLAVRVLGGASLLVLTR